MDSDGSLVTRVLAGDSGAYAGLVERYRDRLGRYAVRMLGNQADAEDALQESFVRGYRSLARCQPPDRFGPWMFGILVNRCRTAGAKRARQEATVIPDEGAMERAAVPSGEERSAWRDAIDRALAQLPPDHREAFLLKHVDELSYDEMMDVTGVKISALKMRVMRARETLRSLLKETVHG